MSQPIFRATFLSADSFQSPSRTAHRVNSQKHLHLECRTASKRLSPLDVWPHAAFLRNAPSDLPERTIDSYEALEPHASSAS